MSRQSRAEAEGGVAGPKPPVFVCYSHQDFRHAKRLRVHVDGCPEAASLIVWDDSQIQPGSLWESEIARALDAARFAVLLVSADFLASPFIIDFELPRLLHLAQSRGTRILPVIVGHCVFKESCLGAFRAVNNPARPLNCLSAAVRDEIWVSLVRVLLSASH